MKYVPPGQPGSIVTVAPRYENFIGGKWLAPTHGKYRVDLTPATAGPITEVADSTSSGVESATSVLGPAVAGFRSTRYLPCVGASHLPPMKFSYLGATVTMLPGWPGGTYFMSLLLRDLNGCGMQIKWSVLCSTWPSTPSASWSIVVVPTRSGTATLTPGSCGRHPQQSPDSQCAPQAKTPPRVAHRAASRCGCELVST